jgi:Domain of unknown function (DUF4979)/Alginate lyase
MKKNQNFCIKAIFAFIGLTFIVQTLSAQSQWKDDFSTGATFNWASNTSGSTSSLVSGKLRVTLVLQTDGTYRGDVKKTQSLTLYPGNFPIIAVKMSKPGKCALTFDTNLGSFNNGSNNHGILYTSDGGKIYYWNLAAGTIGTTTLPTTSGTTFSFIQFKVAGIYLPAADLAAGKTYYDVSWVGSFASEAALRASVTLNYTPTAFSKPTATFTHPGILHSSADLLRIKNFVTTQFGQPYQSYLKLIASPRASSSYTMSGPYATWSRVSPTKTGLENDCKAAYFNAHMWNITGNTAYRDKALQILNAYGSTSTSVASTDIELNGLPAFLLINAAEIMRYTNSGWTSTAINTFGTMMQNLFYPILQNFKPAAHGNWDAICMEALMGIAIFNNDTAMFNRVGRYALNGEGNGSFRWYLLSSGQAQESNRDQAHTQLCLGALCNVAEMAYKQGLETFYSAFSNGLKKGFEYTANYNNGNTGPFVTRYDYFERNYSDYVPDNISATSRGIYRPIYEMAYNHYVIRKGGTMPNTLIAKQNLGAEGETSAADHPSFGTLFFYSGSNAAATSINVPVATENTQPCSIKRVGAYIVGCGFKHQVPVQLLINDFNGKTSKQINLMSDNNGNVQFKLGNNICKSPYTVTMSDGQQTASAKLLSLQ